MKKVKKLMLALVCCVVLVLAFGISANAQENVTQLPCEFKQGLITVDLNALDILDVYYSPSWDGTLTMEYYADIDEYLEGVADDTHLGLQINFMDANYNVVKRERLKDGWSAVESIPSSAAMFVVIMVNDKYENGQIYGGVQYLHYQVLDMYSDAGGVIYVPDLQRPVYEMQGWYAKETMYALDGRMAWIMPNAVEAYKAVGWYERSDYYYHFITDNYWSFMGANDYMSAINVVERYYCYCYSSYYTQIDEMYYKALAAEVNRYRRAGDYVNALEVIRDYGAFVYVGNYAGDLDALTWQVKDGWRNAVGCPITYETSTISREQNYRTGQYYAKLTVPLLNLSYKPVEAFRLKVTCYDVWGDVLYDEVEYYSCTKNAELPTNIWGVQYSWTMGLDFGNIHSFDMQILDVVFADGTRWSR